MPRLPKRARALAPGAVLLFSTAAWAGPYGAAYNVGPIAPFAAGETRVIPVTVTNTGSKPWVYEFCKDRTTFGLAYHWEGPVPVFEGERSYIPKTVKPGESITLPVAVAAPALAGAYTLRFDMVEEGVSWFSQSADQVPTQNVAVTINPKPAAGKITGLTFNYQTGAPGLQTLKVIPVGDDCPFDLDFGDGKTATEKEKDGAGVFHPYAAIGTFTATVKAKAPCTGTASQKLSVASGAAICEFLPILLHSNVITLNFFPFLFEPKIDFVNGTADPDNFTLIFGSAFGLQPGKVEVKGNFGPKYGNAMTLTVFDWDSELLFGSWPIDLEGAPDQTIQLRVVTHDGKATDWVDVPFQGKRRLALIPPSLAQGSCENGTACTKCHDNTDGDCFFASAQGTVSASHISTPVLCALGGGSGTDTWNFNLKNGWKLWKIEQGPTYTFGSSFTLCNPPLGSTSFTCTVSWSVEGCEQLFYSINLFAVGPAGVPMS